jgi:hypothetical protein
LIYSFTISGIESEQDRKLVFQKQETLVPSVAWAG